MTFIIPAVVGVLRVKAGKHYPTDIIAGFIVGAATGITVPALHKKRNNKFFIGLGLNKDERLVMRLRF